MNDKDKNKNSEPDVNEIAHRIVKETTEDKPKKKEQPSQK